MAEYDLILIHAPNILNSEETSPIFNAYLSSSNDVPITDTFEMYPIGFKAMKHYLLTKQGMKVKIINLASLLLSNKNLDIESFFRKQKSLVYGLDLHWQIHLAGVLSVSTILKKIHKKSKILLGGITASYFADELIENKDIDFILRGFYTVDSLYKVLKHVKDGASSFNHVPGLVWKNDTNKVLSNKITLPTKKIYHYEVDWSDYIANVNKMTTLESPQVFLMPSFSCNKNCVWCGGSKYFYRNCFGYKNTIIMRTLASIYREIESLSHSKRPANIYSVGHWHENDKYLFSVLKKMKKAKIGKVSFELWNLMPIVKARKISEYVNPVFICTPESSDHIVSKICGRGSYNMKELDKWVEQIVSIKGAEVQIWFMIGLPKQTKKSVKRDINYCGEILHRYHDKNLNVIITPMLTLDPGSIVYENPEQYGYQLLTNSVAGLQKLMTAPYWKYRLNYQTRWLSRQDIFEISLYAVHEITRIKHKLGLIPDFVYKNVEKEINITRQITAEIDNELESKKYLSDSLKKKIIRENIRRASDNSCVLYSLESDLATKWFFEKYC